jgi:hypothetical protein
MPARIVALVAVLILLPSGGAGAGTPESPELRDQAGDANYVHSHGTLPLPDDGPDTRPASIDGADIVAGWYETEYRTDLTLDGNGAVTAVSYEPEALLVHLRTTGAPIPSFGPTVSYNLWVNVGACSMIFRFYARGALSSEGDPPQGAELRTRKAECLEGPKTYTEDITLAVAGNVTTLRYPFEALSLGNVPLFDEGYLIEADSDGGALQISTSHRLPNGLLFGGQPIDMAGPPQPFVIGSDVPSDVDCLATPGDPACASP